MNNLGIFASGSTSTKAQSRPTSDSHSYAHSNPGGHHSSLSLSMISPMKNPTNKDFCRICSCSFTLINKKLICKGCGEPMCYIHSSLLDRYNLERICDMCMQEILKKQAEDEIAEIKQRYIGELSFSTLEREEKTRLINKAMGRIRKLRIEKKEKDDKFKKESNGLDRILKSIDEEIKDALAKAHELKALLDEQREVENCERERMMMVQAEQEGIMEKVNLRLSVENEVELKAQFLKGEVSKFLGLAGIKKVLCVVCNNVLAAELPEDFREIQPGGKGKGQDEMSRNICTCEIS